MQWIAQNKRDAEMLGLIDLSPLDGAHAQDAEQLAECIRRHNGALVELSVRFRQLADDRHAIAHADRWLGQGGSAIVAERRRLVVESWDVLLALHKMLDERQDILRKIEAHVSVKLTALDEQLEHAVEKARKALSREHRNYLKAEPLRGQAYVEGMVADDEAVAQLRQQTGDLKRVLNSLEELRHKAGYVTSVTIRQREVIAYLN